MLGFVFRSSPAPPTATLQGHTHVFRILCAHMLADPTPCATTAFHLDPLQREPGVWGVLAATGEKAALTSRRNASIDRAYAALEAARRARLERKQHEDKWVTCRGAGGPGRGVP